MVPYHCGSLLPDEQRAGSPTFIRCRRIYQAEDLVLEHAAELVAWVRLVGMPAAWRLFGWDGRTAGSVKRLLAHEPLVRASEPYLQANLAALDEETGLRVWEIISPKWPRDGRFGKPPQIVRDAMKSYYHRTREPFHRMAVRWGVGYEALREWIRPRPRRRVRRDVSAAASFVFV